MGNLPTSTYALPTYPLPTYPVPTYPYLCPSYLPPSYLCPSYLPPSYLPLPTYPYLPTPTYALPTYPFPTYPLPTCPLPTYPYLCPSYLPPSYLPPTYLPIPLPTSIIKHHLQVAQIKDLYKSPDPTDGAANRDAVDDVMGDRSFICPSISFAEQLSSTGVKNYQYRLTHRASNEVWSAWMGVIHGADIQVLQLIYH